MAKNYKIGKEFTANDNNITEENSLYQPIPRNRKMIIRNWKIRINFVSFRTQQNKFCQLLYILKVTMYNVRYGVRQKKAKKGKYK